MDQDKEDQREPNVTDYFEDWHKITPSVFDNSPKGEIFDMEELAGEHAPAPIAPTEENAWFTIEPKKALDERQRQREMEEWVIQHSDDPEETFARMRSAQYFAETTGVDYKYVYENLEEVTEQYYGEKKNGVSTWQAIRNAWKIGRIEDELNQLTWMQMNGLGDQDVIQERMEALRADMPSYDEQKRSWPAKVTRDAAMVVPGMLDTMQEGTKTGLLTGLGCAGVAAVAGQLGPQAAFPEESLTVPGAASVGYAAGQIYGSMEASMQKEAGSAYRNFVENEGMDPELSRAVAIGVGVASGLVEVVQLSSIPGIGQFFKPALEKAVKEFTFDTAGKMFVKGTGKYVANVASNAGEEAIQEIIHKVGQDIAAEHAGIENDPKFWQEMDEVADTAINSFQTFMLINAPGSVISQDSAQIVKKLKEGGSQGVIRNQAGEIIPGPDTETFRATPRSVSVEIDAIESARVIDPGSDEYRLAREQYNRVKESNETLPPIRVIAGEDGTYQAVDEALLQVALEEGEGAVEIELVEGPLPQRQADSIQSTPDWAKTSTEFDSGVERFSATQNEFNESNSRAAFTDNIRTAFPNMTDREVNASVGLVEAVATTQGKEFSQYIGDTFAPGVFTRERVKLPQGNLTENGWNKIAAAIDFEDPSLAESFLETVNFQEIPFEERTYGQNESRKIKPAFWENFLEENEIKMEEWRTKEDIYNRIKNVKIPGADVELADATGYKAARSLLEDGKSLIHLTETSDFSSWVHEYAHVIRPQLNEADQKALMSHYGIKSWDQKKEQGATGAEEAFVRDLENYLLKGVAPSSQLRELFQRISEGLKKIYDRLGQTAEREGEQIPQEIRELFDRIFKDDGTVRAEQNGAEAVYIDDSLPIFQTEAYHGSPHSFDEFSLEHIGAGEGAQAFGWGLYFTDAEDIARLYADNLVTTRVDGVAVEDLGDFEFSAMMDLRRNGGDVDETIQKLNDLAELSRPKVAAAALKKAEWLNANRDKIAKDDRNLYSVTLHEGEDETWLNWRDKFPKDLIPSVKEELTRAGLPADLNGVWESPYSNNGKGVYRKITGLFMGAMGIPEGAAQKYASQLLNRAGIDGIRYPANSMGQAASEKDYNYVVFNDKKVKIDSHVLFQPEEREEIREYLNGDAIAETDGTEVPHFEKVVKLATWADDWAKENGYKNIQRVDLGEIELTRRGFKDSLGHGISEAKIQGIALLPGVIENGKLVYQGEKGAHTGSVIAAPVKIAGEEYIELVLLRQQGENSNKLYVHEVVLKEKAQGASKPIEAVMPDGHPGLLRSIVQELYSVNEDPKTLFQDAPPDDSPAFKEWFVDSVVVDADGNPLVMYHGTSTDFDAFDIKKIGEHASAEGYGFYFTDNREIAEGYERDGGRLLSVYLSIQKPMASDAEAMRGQELKGVLREAVRFEIEKYADEIEDYKDSFLSNIADTYSVSFDDAINEAAEMFSENDTAVDQIAEIANLMGEKELIFRAVQEATGYDGVYVKDFQEGEGDVYLAWFPEQVKSVENQGSWNREDPRILFQDNILEDSDGVAYNVHEERYNYEGEERQKLQEEIQLQFDWLADPAQSESGRSSQVRNQFQKTKRVDFTGLQVAGVKDVAEAFSVYRNPRTEYFHVVYTKGDRIVAHNAMTSGLPGTTLAFEKNSVVKSLYSLDRRMDRLGADGFFLIHNHPSGDTSPSRADLTVTKNYKNNIRGFRGHIILDHDQFGFISENGTDTSHDYIPTVTYKDETLTDKPFTSPDQVAAYLKQTMSDDVRTAYFLMSNLNQVLDVVPVMKASHLDAYQKMRTRGAARVIFATSDEAIYENIVDADQTMQKVPSSERKNDVFLDLFYLNETNGFRSAMEEGRHSPGAWEEHSNKGRNFGFVWENEVLYQESEHEEIIRQAVEDYKPVPQNVLEEYQDRDWAQKEIKRREVWQKYEWLESLAKGFDSWEDLKQWFNDKASSDHTGEIKQMGDEETDRFYHELWMRASFKTRDENNAQFIDLMANEEGVLRLAADIAADRKRYTGAGIPGPIFTLMNAMRGKNGHTDKQVQAAINSIKNNPVQVRRALAAVENDAGAMIALDYEDEIEEAAPYSTKVEDMSIKDRVTEALKTKDPELKKALLTGVGSDSESLLAMERAASRQIAALKAKQTKARNELEEKLGWERSRVISLTNDLNEKIQEAKDAKKMVEYDTLQVIRETKAEIDQKNRKRREILEAKEKMRVLGAAIQRRPSPLTCHVDYQREIQDLQTLIEGKFRRKMTAEEWFRRNKFYTENPNAMKALNQADIEKITKKPLNYWEMTELEDLNEKINVLRTQGRIKLEEQDIARRKRISELSRTMAIEIGDGKMTSAPDVPFTIHNEAYKAWLESGTKDTVKMETWRPSRILRNIGGEGSQMEGYFWREMNKHLDVELKMKNKRIDAGKALMKDLGITMKSLNEPIHGPSGPFPINDVIHWYIVRDNEDNMKALMAGVGIEGIEQYTDQLSPKHIALAEFIAKDFEDNYDRYSAAFAADKNQIMGKVEGGYFPMRRVKMLNTERNEEIAKNLASRAGVMPGTAARHGTHSRIEISEEHQDPILMGAVDNWMKEVEEQEHYINSIQYIREMHQVLADPVFQTAMVDKHGKKMLEWLNKYVNEFANPTLYKFYDSTANFSKMLRNNLAVAYLSFNMMTVAKQAPSLGLFMGRVGPVRLTAAAGKFMTDPIGSLEFVNERDPQMKERSMDRILEELKLQREGKFSKFTKKYGEWGMALITKVDKMATTIGWLAVYDANVGKVGEEEAIRLAQEAVLETQPAARAKDLAQIYRSSEGLNWFLMFSNQINQTWNIITADLPAAVKKASDSKIPKEVRIAQAERAIGIVAGMMTSFAGIAVLSGWKPWKEEEPEEIAKSIGVMTGKALVNTVPLVGGNIVSGYEGWMSTGVDPFPVAAEAGDLLETLTNGEEDQILKRIGKVAETAGVMAGIPVMPVKRGKRAVKALAEGEAGDAFLEALGYRTGGDY